MVNKDFFLALEDLEREKGISQEVFIEALENALVIAYKRNSGISGGVEVKLNPEKAKIQIFSVRNIVDEVVDKDKEIIAAQTAKQVIMQKLRETERDNTITEFCDKENEIMNCVVRRIEDKTVYVEIGKGEIEGVLLPSDQVPGEKYELNQKIKVYVKRVRNNGRNAQIMVSRTAAGLVQRLFENEVPEIRQGVVEIKAVSREAGQRTKIAICSHDPAVDAVGACVGNKGARVNAIVQELNGEKIDIILWSEDPLEYIAKALSPAKVIKVSALEGEKVATVVVPDDKLSLAIGRDGQNVRLAARLTGWKIDVKSESKAMAEIQSEMEESEAEDTATEEN